MRWFSKITFYVRSLFLRQKLDAQLSDEIQSHVEMATEANIAAGMSPKEARYAALREFGNIASVQERTRDEHGWVWLEQWGKDVGFACRSLVRARGFSLTVIATLVVGVIVAAVVLSLTNRILFRPLPFPDPEELVLFNCQDQTGVIQNGIFGSEFLAYQEQGKLFSEFAAVEQFPANVMIDGVLSGVVGLNVSVDFFHTLGIKQVLGRCFLSEDFVGGTANVVVISNGYWREKLQAAPSVIGRQLFINEQTYTIIGVLAEYSGFSQGDVYRPLALRFDPAQPFSSWLMVLGRMKTGVSREQATDSLATVKPVGLGTEWGSFLADRHLRLTDPASLVDRKPYWLLLAGGAILFGSACLNGMNLMLARLLGRQREFGIRLSLGGGRWQVARLLVIENTALVFVAGLLVVFAWHWFYPPLSALLMGNTVKMDSEGEWWEIIWGDALAGILGLTLIAGVAITLVPVWRLLKSDFNSAMKEGLWASGESRRLSRLRNGLVVMQAAFAVVLLIGTGLMVRSFEHFRRVDLGFNPVGKVNVQIAMPREYNPVPEVRLQLFERLAARLATLPGVKGVTYGQEALLGGEWGGEPLKLADGSMTMVGSFSVAADYPQIAGLTLIKGRWFAARTAANSAPIEIVINETMARGLFGDRDPIGLQIPDRHYVVVGVVHDVKGAIRPKVGMHYYAPAWSNPQLILNLLMRMDGESAKEFSGLVQRTIYSVEPKLIVLDVRTPNERIRNELWSERIAYSVLQALTPVALGLAVIGLFSVLAYNVETRMREFGVRMALGATPADLQRVVLKRGVGTAAIGVSLGIFAALGLTRFMQSLLFETTPYDPLVFVGVAMLLLGSAALACWLPARRAAKVDPVIALRSE